LTLIWYKRRFPLLRQQLAFTCDPRKPHVKPSWGILRWPGNCIFTSGGFYMKKAKAFAITLFCLATLIGSSTAMGAPRKRGTPSCCKMKRCCYSDMRCCKKANHACCTG